MGWAPSKDYKANFADIEWLPIKSSVPTTTKQGARGPTFIPDIKEFVSPLDFSVISSRSQLREHERKHNVRQCGDLRKPEDYSIVRNEPGSERKLEGAYRAALEKAGML